MKKLKEFFSPVDAKYQAGGLKFGPWIMGSFARYGLFLLFPIAITLIAIFEGPDKGWDPEWAFGGVESFFSAIWLFFIFKTLQHWNDLKHGNSR